MLARDLWGVVGSSLGNSVNVASLSLTTWETGVMCTICLRSNEERAGLSTVSFLQHQERFSRKLEASKY